MFWKRFFIVIGILVILAFVAQLLAAPYVKGLIIKGLKESLGVDVTIGDCAVSVLKRTVILDDVTVINPEKQDDYLLKAKEISVDFYLLPSLFNKYILDNITMTSPEVILYLDEAGKLKVPQFKKGDGAKKGELLFKRFAIEDGNFKFIDQRVSKPATITQFSSIDCEIINSVSLSERTVITVISAKGNIEGQGKFSVDGKGKFAGKPISFEGNIKIGNVPIPKFSVYYGDLLPVKVNKGNLFIDTKASCDKGNLDVRNAVSIKDLDLEPIGDPNQTVLFELKTADVITFLKDENDTVNFSFQISGDLNKPDFKWGAEIGRALRSAMLKSFNDGVIRLLRTPDKAGEVIGNMLGDDAGEAVKKLGNKINKELEKIMGK